MGENGCGVPARAGQFGPLDEARLQLAAKDGEIAELRAERDSLRELAGCAYQAMGVHDAPDEWLDALSNAAVGRPFQTETLLPYAPDSVCDAERENAELRAKLAALDAQHQADLRLLARTVDARDEARECVKRLCGAVRPFAENTPLEPGGQIVGLMREDFASASAALAATPEHLRGAPSNASGSP